jgi:hypothetical protein
MKITLPILAIALGAIATWWLEPLVPNRSTVHANPARVDLIDPLDQAPMRTPEHARSIASPSPAALSTADRIIARSIRQSTSYESLSARLRVEINLYGQQLVGTGTYRQVGPVSDQLLRLDLDMGTGDSLIRLQQVNNGRYVWLKRDAPALENPGEREQSVSRIDLRAARESLAAKGVDISHGAIHPALTSIGGLGQLLRELDRNFAFEPEAKSDQLRGHPVWLLRGHWKNNAAIGAAADHRLSNKLEDRSPFPLPPLPRTVIVWLGQIDGIPHRIGYFGSSPTRPHKADGIALLAMWDLLSIQVGHVIDPRHFGFKYNDFDDTTSRFVARVMSQRIK